MVLAVERERQNLVSEDNIKQHFSNEMEDSNWIYLPQGRNHWLSV
jgi:hypothetical protein